jgi:hypothetical protein
VKMPFRGTDPRNLEREKVFLEKVGYELQIR